MTKIKYPIGGYAPGNYMSECVTCKEQFMGDKYARQCEPCAINTMNDGIKQLTLELREARSIVTKLKEVKDLLNKIDIDGV